MPTESPTAIAIVDAIEGERVCQARELFEEYGSSLGFSLCFQSFDKELAELPGDYARPKGRLLLAMIGDRAVGCVALHRCAGCEADVAEMKRLYVRPEGRGKGIGRMLVERALGEATHIGYSSIRLDTLAGVMDTAIELYRRMGFHDIAPYRHNPRPGVVFLERELNAANIAGAVRP